MTKSQIYTRGGDKGETSLVSGTRIPKCADVISLYGTLDELNSHLGFLICLCRKQSSFTPEIASLFEKTQSAFFDLGSKLACESEFWEKYKLPDIRAELIIALENQIDSLDEQLPKLKSFILPGGSEAASYAHVVRTVCRRVERELVRHKDSGFRVPDRSLEFLNRFSDFIFVFSRYLNFKVGEKEVLWKPNSN